MKKISSSSDELLNLKPSSFVYFLILCFLFFFGGRCRVGMSPNTSACSSAVTQVSHCLLWGSVLSGCSKAQQREPVGRWCWGVQPAFSGGSSLSITLSQISQQSDGGKQTTGLQSVKLKTFRRVFVGVYWFPLSHKIQKRGGKKDDGHQTQHTHGCDTFFLCSSQSTASGPYRH